jgi:hypothetical protein
MTGRGEGYCILELPGPDQPSRGYAGLERVPVRLEPPPAEPVQSPPATVWPRPIFGCGRGRAARRGRGRRFPGWERGGR